MRWSHRTLLFMNALRHWTTLCWFFLSIFSCLRKQERLYSDNSLQTSPRCISNKWDMSTADGRWRVSTRWKWMIAHISLYVFHQHLIDRRGAWRAKVSLCHVLKADVGKQKLIKLQKKQSFVCSFRAEHLGHLTWFRAISGCPTCSAVTKRPPHLWRLPGIWPMPHLIKQIFNLWINDSPVA